MDAQLAVDNQDNVSLQQSERQGHSQNENEVLQSSDTSENSSGSKAHESTARDQRPSSRRSSSSISISPGEEIESDYYDSDDNMKKKLGLDQKNTR